MLRYILLSQVLLVTYEEIITFVLKILSSMEVEVYSVRISIIVDEDWLSEKEIEIKLIWLKYIVYEMCLHVLLDDVVGATVGQWTSAASNKSKA